MTATMFTHLCFAQDMFTNGLTVFEYLVGFNIPDSSTLKRVMKAQKDLLERLRPFDFKDKASQPIVTLAVDRSTKSMVAPAGSFKTCHPASFVNLDKLSQAHITAVPILGLEAIVVKHVYWRVSGPTSSHKQLTINDKLVKTLDEANCLYWATSLINLLYSYIDKTLACRAPTAPTIIVPRLHLVHSAVAVPQDSCEASAAVYLLEEKITGKFVKYINNNSATLRQNLEESELNIAEFLCFAQHAQHAQYNITQGLVFLSDFQGAGDLLTDCQVITTPDYAKSFSDGNWTKMLHNFPKRHNQQILCGLGFSVILSHPDGYVNLSMPV
ncbi:hypothetical protein SERLADRAFT_417646 [Serpula lacrymans var. lacrymans S7.9]|uniref:Alpha-type protein kinase domain-containing protein n=1 Tax=Serpula lacrymans var. lacrymans (strain S7.9) TaxID=578457 RepID=F8P7B9_SERL9|nr:uncharacterized protein SERLADRAFT_417646 [Serpula lacrymans var. lacrymans S7.9]EGO21335.1 hypothetical protein SERLADRAFT_417646 [Serpula lacrymans var. lacrymans S7.9]